MIIQELIKFFLRSEARAVTFWENYPVCRLAKWELVRLCGIYMVDQRPDFSEKYSYMANDFYSSEIKLLLMKLC